MKIYYQLPFTDKDSINIRVLEPERNTDPIFHKKIHVKKSTQEQKNAFTSLVHKTISEISTKDFLITETERITTICI